MYIGTTILSKKRIMVCLRRYWWILALGILTGVGYLSYGINQNINKQQEYQVQVSYESQFLVSTSSNHVSSSTVIGDCEMLLRTEAMLQYVNQYLDDANTLKNLDGVTLTRINASNSFMLKMTMTQDIGEKISEYIIQYFNLQIAKYHKDVTIYFVEGKEVVLPVQSQVLDSKSVLLCFAIIAVSVAAFYVVLISGKSILTMEEANNILHTNHQIVIETSKLPSVLQRMKRECIAQARGYVLFSKSLDNLAEGTFEGNIKCVKFGYGEDIDLELAGCDIWMFLQANDVTVKELAEFKDVCEWNRCDIKYLVFVE